MDIRHIVQTIVNRYKEKFHRPIEREVYVAQVELHHFIGLVLLLVLFGFLWFQTSKSLDTLAPQRSR